MPERLRMSGISKRFPGVNALADVSLAVQPGEVHAVVGKNGAGKSTLMKILAGAYTKDEGRIFLDGREVSIEDPLHAQHLGIAIIYQHLNMIPDLTAAENIFVGRFPRKGRRIDFAAMNSAAAALLREVGAKFAPTATVASLSLADKQLIAVAKALSMNASIVVMDEPTSSLTPAEVEMLFGIVKKISAAGTSVIFISHHMDEIFSPRDAVRAGIALIPEDRGGEGAILDDTVSRNISLPLLAKFFRRGRIDEAAEKGFAQSFVDSLRIKTPTTEQKVEFLSGGNQQKVVLAKWFGTKPKILILDEPTRGIDVGAKAEIYRLVSRMAAEGVGVMMISSELPELMALLYQGNVP